MGQTGIVDTTNTNVAEFDLYSENGGADENVVDSYDLLASVYQVVRITNTPIMVTQTGAISKHNFSQIELTQHYSLHEHSSSYNRLAKRDPKQKSAILTSASATLAYGSSNKFAVGTGSLIIEECSSIRSHTIGQPSVAFASYNNDFHPQDGMEFDPGGSNIKSRRGLVLVKRRMTVKNWRIIVTRIVGKNIPSSVGVSEELRSSTSQCREMIESACADNQNITAVVLCIGKSKLLVWKDKVSMSLETISDCIEKFDRISAFICMSLRADWEELRRNVMSESKYIFCHGRQSLYGRKVYM